MFLLHLTQIRQIYLNYRNKTGDGISFNFLLLWLIGDIMNILGIILQKLMFTVVSSHRAVQKSCMATFFALLILIVCKVSPWCLLHPERYHHCSSSSLLSKDLIIPPT
jgi:PQ loop repeat